MLQRPRRGRTGSIRFIGEVGSVLRAWEKSAPESTAAQARLDTGNVGVVLQTAIFKLAREIARVDAVSIEISHHNEKIVVAICATLAEVTRNGKGTSSQHR